MELLKLALALLIAAQGANVPMELKNQAILVAQTAIVASINAPVSYPGASETPIAIQAATSSKKAHFEPTGPGYWNQDGCYYARPIGAKNVGTKNWCPK